MCMTCLTINNNNKTKNTKTNCMKWKREGVFCALLQHSQHRRWKQPRQLKYFFFVPPLLPSCDWLCRRLTALSAANQEICSMVQKDAITVLWPACRLSNALPVCGKRICSLRRSRKKAFRCILQIQLKTQAVGWTHSLQFGPFRLPSV